MRFLAKALLSASLLLFASISWAININTADAKALAKELDGVGDKMAATIIEERKKAPFTSLDDVDKRVKGWGKKTSEKNKGKVTFSDK
jgi:competence protein ComEA